MTGSMYAAVSGLKAHMSALNVIGNNVSNVNTVGYKATRYTFNEAIYTMSRSGSNGTLTAGGRNPAQIGFGASIGTIDLDMSTKNYTPTGQALDTMIDGDGFFFVNDKELGDGATAVLTGDQASLAGMKLTRLGNFNIDPNGYLVDGNGQVVWGFLETADKVGLTSTVTDTTGSWTETSTKIMDTYFDLTTGKTAPAPAADATNTTVKKLCMMSAEEIEKLQKLGANLHNLQYESMTETKKAQFAAEAGTETDETKRAYLQYLAGLDVGKQYLTSATMTETSVMAAIRLPMKTEGKEIAWPQYIQRKNALTTTGDNPTTVLAAEPAKMRDYEGIGSSRLQADSVSIDEKTGALRVMTSDGTLYTVGYLAIGKVTNPNGVTHVDGRYYQAQDGAGTLRVTTVKGAVSGPKDENGNVEGPETAGGTTLITGGLESSGTDLATEITNMITVQRGYQANTRIVTVTDSMLEELVNMKR